MLSTVQYIISDPLQTDYVFAFDWVRLSHVSPTVNGVAVPSTDYSFLAGSTPGASTIRFSGATLAAFSVNDIISISKETPLAFNDRTVDFSAATTVTEEALDDAMLHNLSAIQDLSDRTPAPGVFLARITDGNALVADTASYTAASYLLSSVFDLAFIPTGGWVPYGALGIAANTGSTMTLDPGTYEIEADPRLYNALSASANVAVAVVNVGTGTALAEARSAADRIGGETAATFGLKMVFNITATTTISVRAVCLTGEDVRTAGGYLKVKRLNDE